MDYAHFGNSMVCSNEVELPLALDKKKNTLLPKMHMNVETEFWRIHLYSCKKKQFAGLPESKNDVLSMLYYQLYTYCNSGLRTQMKVQNPIINMWVKSVQCIKDRYKNRNTMCHFKPV